MSWLSKTTGVKWKYGGGGEGEARRARRLAQKQTEAAEKAAAFQTQRMERWEGAFGGLAENVGNYYRNLTPTRVASQGLQNVEQQFSAAAAKNAEALSQRGFGGSKFAAYSQTQGQYAKAAARANVLSNAPQQVAAQQAGFLNIGLQAEANIAGGVNAAYGNQIAAYGQQAQLAQQASQAEKNRSTSLVNTVAAVGLAYFTGGASLAYMGAGAIAANSANSSGGGAL